MKFADHTKLDRKSGEAEGSAVLRTFHGNDFRRGFTTIPTLRGVSWCANTNGGLTENLFLLKSRRKFRSQARQALRPKLTAMLTARHSSF
jgi:hypothetical protein